MKVRYYGHNGMLSGYGRAADEMVEALAAAGAELEVRPLGPSASMAASTARFYRRDEELTQPDVIIVHTLPLAISKIIGEIGNDANLVDLPTVAYTTWEALDVPDRVLRSVAEADALWVPSRITKNAFVGSFDPRADGIAPAVHAMPHAYDDARDYRYTGEREPQPFTFYWIGDWTVRKNPTGLIRAFCSEFARDENVRLLLQSRGTPRETFIAAMASTGIPQAEWPKVTFSNKELTEPELWAIHAHADVYVTAARGEAWNLPAFEAVLAGRHIISPGGLGSDDFLEDTTAALYLGAHAPAYVDIRAAPPVDGAPPGALNLQVVGAQGLDCRCHWQEPELTALQHKMREAFQHDRRSIELEYDIARSFGRAAVGQLAMDLLKEIKPQ